MTIFHSYLILIIWKLIIILFLSLVQCFETVNAHPVATGTGVAAGVQTLQILLALLQARYALSLHAWKADKYEIMIIRRGAYNVFRITQIETGAYRLHKRYGNNIGCCHLTPLGNSLRAGWGQLFAGGSRSRHTLWVTTQYRGIQHSRRSHISDYSCKIKI